MALRRGVVVVDNHYMMQKLGVGMEDPSYQIGLHNKRRTSLHCSILATLFPQQIADKRGQNAPAAYGIYPQSCWPATHRRGTPMAPGPPGP